MEDINSLENLDEIPDKNNKKETLEIKNKNQESISINELNNTNSEIKLTEDNIDKESKKIVEDNNKDDSIPKLNSDKLNINKNNAQIIKEKTTEDTKLSNDETNSVTNTIKSTGNIDKGNKEIVNENKLDENKKVNLTTKTNANVVKNTSKEISTIPVKAKTKPVKEPPIEKKPFLEFVNEYLIPEIRNEFKLKGKEVNKINLQKTHRPIAEDICWVIYCEISDTCNFWLSFEKDDITSLKSFSLCKNYEKPSIIESFLIDEKKITLKLIISRILQRLNGQKLIGAN